MFLNNNIKIQFNKICFQPTRITKKLSEFFNNFEKYGLDNYCKQSNFKKLELSFLSNGFNLNNYAFTQFPTILL